MYLFIYLLFRSIDFFLNFVSSITIVLLSFFTFIIYSSSKHFKNPIDSSICVLIKISGIVVLNVS